MKKVFLTTLSLLVVIAYASARDIRYGVMYPYPACQGKETPPPAGYKPFYISHFGRHGSRYLSMEKMALPALNPLAAAKEEGLLTHKGEELFEKVSELYSESNKMWGQLSCVGVEEHKAIAGRMFRRSADVFTDSVHILSSTYPRCIISMAASAGEIARLAPKTKWSYKTGKRYQSIVNTSHRPSGWISGASLQKEYLKEHLDAAEVLSRIFKNPERGMELVGNPVSFLKAVYHIWAGREAIGLEPFNLDVILGKDTVDLLAASDNLANYHNMAIPNADSLVMDIVEKADAAIGRQKPSADLRYGHDNGLMRLLVQIGMEGYPRGLETGQAAGFCFADKIPLAANLQIIFYRNRKGRVLVKFLVNEKECALNPLSGGPYYAWEDVRSHFLETCTSGYTSF